MSDQEAKPSTEDLGDKKEGEYIKLKVIGQKLLPSLPNSSAYYEKRENMCKGRSIEERKNKQELRGKGPEDTAFQKGEYMVLPIGMLFMFHLHIF